MRTAKTLNRLGGCPGRSESSLGAHSFCWSCHVMANLRRQTLTSLPKDKSIWDDRLLLPYQKTSPFETTDSYFLTKRQVHLRRQTLTSLPKDKSIWDDRLLLPYQKTSPFETTDSYFLTKRQVHLRRQTLTSLPKDKSIWDDRLLLPYQKTSPFPIVWVSGVLFTVILFSKENPVSSLHPDQI